MKLNQIALAVAAACVAAPSFALTPAQIAADPGTVQLWISGATAPTASVYGAIRKVCLDADNNGAPDDLHVYLTNNLTAAQVLAGDAVPGKSNAGKFAAYACTMGNLAGSLEGVQTVVYHTFDIGSFEAYTPHLALLPGFSHPSVSTSVKRLKDITLGSSTCALVTDPGAPANTYENCGSLSVPVGPNEDEFSTPTLPQGGFSDTEYVLNQLNLGISAEVSDIGTDDGTNVGQVFGLAVSYPLYFAMQQKDIAAGKLAATCDDAPFTSLSPNLTGACQPNATRQQYTSLVSTSGVTNKDGSLFGGAVGSVIQVQRRVGTSGTQSSSNAFFLNAPCATGKPAGALAPAGSNLFTPVPVSFNGGKVLVNSNEGSGNVKTALTTASNNGSLAIGVLSLENSPSATEKFAFVKLNSVSPNFNVDPGTGAIVADAKQRVNAISGDYEMSYELVGFTAASAYTEGADLINGVRTALGDTTITDLKGLFVTKASGGVGGSKVGNSCKMAVQ
jgi:hypothetical protein